MTEYQEEGCSGEWMQQLEMYVRTVARRCAGTLASVIRMSADDDNQADQQCSLTDLGMAKTDHSVLDMP